MPYKFTAPIEGDWVMSIVSGYVAIKAEHVHGEGEREHLFDARYDTTRKVIVYCAKIAHCGERRKNNVPGTWMGGGISARRRIYLHGHALCAHCAYPFCVDYSY